MNGTFLIETAFKLAKTANFKTMEGAMYLVQKLICMNSVTSQVPLETVRKIESVFYYNGMT